MVIVKWDKNVERKFSLLTDCISVRAKRTHPTTVLSQHQTSASLLFYMIYRTHHSSLLLCNYRSTLRPGWLFSKQFPTNFVVLSVVVWKLYHITRHIEQIVLCKTFKTDALPHYHSVFRTICMNFAKILSTQQHKKNELHSTLSLNGFMLAAAAGSGYTLSTLSMSHCRMEETAVRIW